MKRATSALIFAALLAGCASTQHASVPALDGTPRVPVNKSVPDTVPYTVPFIDTTNNTPGE